MEIQIILALAALGCCTGFLAGLLGIGGGMVLTPFLTLLLGYAGIPIEHIVHVAIATSMGTILFTSLSSVRAHAKRGAVLWNVVFSMAPGILVGAVVGAQVSGALPTFWVPQKCSSMPNPRLRVICRELQACLVPVRLSA